MMKFILYKKYYKYYNARTDVRQQGMTFLFPLIFGPSLAQALVWLSLSSR